MKKRSQIEEEYKWNLDEYFKSDKEYEDTFKSVEPRIAEFEVFKKKLNNSDTIYKALELEEEINLILERLYVYASLRVREDVSISKNNEREEKISSLITRFSVATTFIGIELNELSDEFLNGLLKEKRFNKYRVLIKDIIKNKPHTLSLKEENILSATGDFVGGYQDVLNKFGDADLKFNKIKDSNGRLHELSQSNASIYLASPDRTLRKNALTELNGAFGRYNNFLATNYISHIKEDTFFTGVRKFNSSLESAIFYEDASVDVYKTLIKAVRKNTNIFERYMKLKAKALNLKDIAIYDIFAPVHKESTKKYNYHEAMEIIKKACGCLGPDYVRLLENAENNRWIDVYPSENKESGAFSWGAYGCHPVVFTNYSGMLNDVSTLAHELGHTLHSYLSDENQPYPLAGYVIYVAEVASTTNEMLLLRYLIRNSKSDEEKLTYYDRLLSDVRSTIFRQTMFAEFEEFAHETYEKSHALSKDILNEKYYELVKTYHGEGVKLIDEIKYEWSRVPHFYNSFYVYKYATGLISAIMLSNNIYEGKAGAVEKYLNFLKSGCTKPPVELLKDAGVNLESENTFFEVFEYINEILNDYERIIKH